MRKMHRFLKILILIIFFGGVTLPWTLSYLSQGTNFQEVENNLISKHRQKRVDDDDKITVGIVACGDKPLNQSIVLLKSIILSSIYYNITSLEAILFADDEHLHSMDLKVEALKNSTKGIKFRYEIHPVIFPARNHDEWKNLFKPCASQRLFLHSALPHINKILYLDGDTLVVGDIRKLWLKFKNMSTEQSVGLVQEYEIALSNAWYNRFAQHPYYPPYGLNTGVMLMNLSRLRNQSGFDWEQAILKSYKKYKDKLAFGDQDLINIVFHDRPDIIYLLPCPSNFRTDHCIHGLSCNLNTAYDGNGIQIIHGSRSAFLKEKEFPLFHKLYKYYEKFEMSKNDFIKDLVIPFKKEAHKFSQQRNTKITPDCDNISHMLFTFLSHHFYIH